MTASPDTSRQSAFGYSLDPAREVGFYVVCSERMILDIINSIMMKKGLVGISDTAGRLHYMVDARTGANVAAGRIAGQALRGLDHSSLSNAEVLEGVEHVLDSYFLDRALLGTRIARFMLVQSIRDPSLMSTVTKRLYPLAGEEFGITSAQVERNLRYAFRKMKVFEDGRRNVYILRKLHDEVSATLVRRHDCVPYPTRLSV